MRRALLETTLQKADVEINAAAPSSGLGTQLLYWIILLAPFIVVFWLVRRMSRAAGGAGPLGGLMGVGRARAKVFDAERPQTKFSDVAGYESAKREISEVVDFQRIFGAYRRLGDGQPPRGVLMVGPPGTGKTLMARAVAGEAEVPFISRSGSQLRGAEPSRGPGPRPVRRGPQTGPLHHLHRRDRRDWPAPGGIRRRGLQR